MNRWTRTAAAAALLAAGGFGCAGAGGDKAAMADPVARGAAPDGLGGLNCPTCPGGGCAGGAGAVGGTRYNNLVDPCWPQRYSYAARQEVLNPFAIQVNNAAILDQTMWNWYFLPGTDTLNPAGEEKLNYIVRRRPAVSPQIYLQTTRDLDFDPTKPDQYVTGRATMNEKRAQAVLRYLAAQTATRPVDFAVTVVDPAETGIAAIYPANSVRGLIGQYRAGIIGATTAGGVGGAGGAILTAPTGAVGGGTGTTTVPR